MEDLRDRLGESTSLFLFGLHGLVCNSASFFDVGKLVIGFIAFQDLLRWWSLTATWGMETYTWIFLLESMTMRCFYPFHHFVDGCACDIRSTWLSGHCWMYIHWRCYLEEQFVLLNKWVVLQFSCWRKLSRTYLNGLLNTRGAWVRSTVSVWWSPMHFITASRLKL